MSPERTVAEAALNKEFSEFLIGSSTRWDDHKQYQILVFNLAKADDKTISAFIIRARKGKWAFVVTIDEKVCVERYTGRVRSQDPQENIREDI